MSATEMQAWAAAAARSESLTKIYGEGDAAVRALDAVTVAFQAGHFTAIMGPSGSGKSTLLHCLAGLDTPSSGRVLIGDVDLTTLSEKELTLLRREKVGFVFQAYNLIPTLTAAENITLPLDIAGDKPDRSWFDQVVDAVGLRDRLHHRPSELSGGQQQRVAGARALVSRAWRSSLGFSSAAARSAGGGLATAAGAANPSEGAGALFAPPEIISAASSVAVPRAMSSSSSWARWRTRASSASASARPASISVRLDIRLCFRRSDTWTSFSCLEGSHTG